MPFTAAELSLISRAALQLTIHEQARMDRQEFRDQYSGTVRGGFGSSAGRYRRFSGQTIDDCGDDL